MKRFFNSILAAFMCCLVSCVSYEHVASTSKGNYERDKIVSVGGSNSQHGADGSSIATSHTRSFRDFTQAVVAVAGGIAVTQATKSNNALSATKDTNATNASINANNNAAATAQQAAALSAKSGAYNTAVGAGAVPTVGTVTPP